mgnify:CR=1 FL=1|tara:strand:+ start:2226 stop:3380 length:1155 start_codon:yes stop_codon:yes gene_type:complete
MANIPIWPGSSSFFPGDTPFGFYDNDFQFQQDADKFAKFASQRLGYPLVEVELQDINFYTAFEEAITTYGNELYAYQVADNLLTFQGASSSIGPANEELAQENLSEVVRLSNQYGVEAGVGGNVTYYTGSFPLTAGKQEYDMNEWATSESIEGRIEIRRIFYESPPAITRYFDPYAGTGVGMQQMMDGFGWGGMSPAINFMLMPINYDLQKIQAIELNDQIRKSQYTFELVNNKLRIFPIPNSSALTFMSFHYLKLEETNQPYYDRDGREIITNASNVPYQNPNYTRINSIGRQWIFEYSLSIVKEILGYVRGKYSNIPIPGSEVTLNQSDLITAATSEKGALIERLRAYFDSTSRKTLLEKKAAEGEAQNKIISDVPMVIFVG